MGFLLRIFNYYFNLACPKVRRNIVSSSNVPWINNKVITVRTILKILYDLYMESKIQEHRDKYQAYKKGIQWCNKNCKKQTHSVYYN
jgi:hypothetical protein